jgi:hypothetical protein
MLRKTLVTLVSVAALGFGSMVGSGSMFAATTATKSKSCRALRTSG